MNFASQQNDDVPTPPNDFKPGRFQFSLKSIFLATTVVALITSLTIRLGSAALIVSVLGMLIFVVLQDRWGLMVVLLYGMFIGFLAFPLILFACLSEEYSLKVYFEGLATLYSSWGFWAWIELMMLSQAVLLVVPVRVANNRPVTRRRVLIPILMSGLLMGLLVLGAGLALLEFFSDSKNNSSHWTDWAPLGLGVTTWICWGFLFFLTSRNKEPKGLVVRQCRLLLAGSILELLIAVPTHIVARSRDVCCAGIMTFLGITFGATVMLISFGPGVFFLFVERWRRIRPKLSSRSTTNS